MGSGLEASVEEYLKAGEAYQACLAGRPSLHVQGIEGFPLALLCRMIARKRKGRLWVVCPTEEVALMMLRDCGIHVSGRKANEQATSEMNCVYLPSSGKILSQEETEDGSDAYERVRALSRIGEMSEGLVVTHLRPFVGPVLRWRISAHLLWSFVWDLLSKAPSSPISFPDPVMCAALRRPMPESLPSVGK
jgi:transcription-repair coupling factor (superfamily II helicase)